MARERARAIFIVFASDRVYSSPRVAVSVSARVVSTSGKCVSLKVKPFFSFRPRRVSLLYEAYSLPVHGSSEMQLYCVFFCVSLYTHNRTAQKPAGDASEWRALIGYVLIKSRLAPRPCSNLYRAQFTRGVLAQVYTTCACRNKKDANAMQTMSQCRTLSAGGGSHVHINKKSQL